MSDGKEIVIVENVQLGALQIAPEHVIDRATKVAGALAKIIRDRGLSSKIRNKEYVRVEGWTTLCAMLGVTPREVSNEVDDLGVYICVVELVRTSDGAVIGRASGECGNPDEVDREGKAVWASRPAYARRSMAATRATGKACRLSFSWIVALAGFEPTPAEEMDGIINGPITPTGPRTKNQWEQPILDKIMDLQLVEVRQRAVGALNRSPFMDVPYGKLEMQEAVAYIVGWVETKNGNPELDTDARALIVNKAWANKKMREKWLSKALNLLGEEE